MNNESNMKNILTQLHCDIYSSDEVNIIVIHTNEYWRNYTVISSDEANIILIHTSV
jgi:hypothetical protein